MDENGDECKECETYVCMVSHDWVYPGMCFVMDDVGGGTSQKSDGHIR